MTLKSLINKVSDFEPRTLGEHIRKRRLILGITQEEAGKRIGTTKFTVINWESGLRRPVIKYIPALIRFLGYDPEPPVCTTLSEQLAAKRRSLGWSQKVASRKLGIDPCTWSSWENGGTIMGKAHRRTIAEFLGLPEDELYAAMRKRWNDSHGKLTPK